MTNELKDLVSTYRQSGPVFALKQGLAAALKREFKQQFQGSKQQQQQDEKNKYTHTLRWVYTR